MCDDKGMKEQTRVLFYAAVGLGIIGGVLGHLVLR
jgi:hypothetical protein